jgi:hypothetical protein
MRFLRSTAILILVGLPSACALETASPRRPAPLVTSYTLGGFVHILLVIALIVLVVNLVQGRRPW